MNSWFFILESEGRKNMGSALINAETADEAYRQARGLAHKKKEKTGIEWVVTNMRKVS